MIKVLKYVVSKENIPILFDTNILHSDVLVHVLSAGFVIISYDKKINKFSAKCYGESSTLKIGSKENDNLIIEEFSIQK